MKVVFFGSSKFVIPILEVLRDNFNLALVMTTERIESDSIIRFCVTNKIPYLSVSNLSNPTIRHTLNAKRSPLGVLAYFGLIIPPKILNLFPKGILNIHPSLLPKYRGPTPGQTAILNGDKTTGITLIKLDEKIDHGPILAQVEEKILPTDTAETLYQRLFQIGAKLLEQNMTQYIKRQIKASFQDDSKATMTRRLTRKDGYFDIKNPPSLKILDQMIRAYHPWPGVWSKWQMANGSPRGEAGKWQIVKFLPGKKIQVEGGKPMSYKDFINGYPEAKEILPFLT